MGGAEDTLVDHRMDHSSRETSYHRREHSPVQEMRDDDEQ